MERFADNLARTLAMHRLTAREAATLLEVSESALSKWQQGTRSPSFQTAIKIGDALGIPADRLARAEFEDLLGNELADPERFRRVEEEIASRGIHVSHEQLRNLKESGQLVTLEDMRDAAQRAREKS